MTLEDHALVTAAVTAAESATDGEIVTVVSARSDKYHDVALHWAIVAMLAAMALTALFPAVLVRLLDLLMGAWREAPSPGELLAAMMVLSALTFAIALLLLRVPSLRYALTPPATKTRRVRARALELFKVGAEHRTQGRTGILLYLSLAERRAEIVADAAIHSKVAPEVWGDAMAELVTLVKQERPGEGMAAAVARMGEVLATHFPRAAADTNEVPDRLIEL